jgi:hypothetical protein
MIIINKIKSIKILIINYNKTFNNKTFNYKKMN